MATAQSSNHGTEFVADLISVCISLLIHLSSWNLDSFISRFHWIVLLLISISFQNLCYFKPRMACSFPSALSELSFFRSCVYLLLLLFGHIWPQLQHAGSLLSHAVTGLSSRGLVAQWHVGSYFPDQGLNLSPLHCKAGS